jgi:hypothetical protein
MQADSSGRFKSNYNVSIHIQPLSTKVCEGFPQRHKKAMTRPKSHMGRYGLKNSASMKQFSTKCTSDLEAVSIKPPKLDVNID